MKKLLLLITFAISLQGFSQFPAPYCAEVFNTGVEPITLVNFAGINNVTPEAIGGTAHEDFTTLVGNVSAGGTYPITLKGNSDGIYNNNYVVFVDWNSDNDFLDASEKYNIGSISNSTGTDAKSVVGVISVPANATAGNRRMRVSKKYSADQTIFQTSCNISGTLNYGQAEDYTLSVSIPTCFAPSNGLAIINPFLSANLTWTVGSGANVEIVYQLVGAGIPVVPANTANSGTNATSTYTTPSLVANSNYEFYVRTECTDGVSYSTWSGPYFFNTFLAPDCAVKTFPANGAININSALAPATAQVTFTWAAPANANLVTSYDFYYSAAPNTSAGTLVGNYPTTSATINLSGYNLVFYWNIIAKGPGGSAIGCSPFSFTTKPNPLATDTFSSINFQSFPNPVKDILNLSYDKNITAVSVINLLGQEVLASKLNSNDAKIDMARLTAGVYMIKISSDNEVKTIKIIKE